MIAAQQLKKRPLLLHEPVQLPRYERTVAEPHPDSAQSSPQTHNLFH